MEPYEYTDPDDRKLIIWQRNPAAGTDARMRIHDGYEATITVKQSDVREITGKLYEACGLPSPVILERPDVTSPDTGPQRRGSVTAGRLRGKVLVGLYGIQPEELVPAEARSLAALIAAHADAAEVPEPDPAEVEDLAHAIRLGLYPGSDRAGVRVGDGDRDAARTALRWMNARGKRDA